MNRWEIPNMDDFPCRALEYCLGGHTFTCDDCPHPEINPLARPAVRGGLFTYLEANE